ncbi:hypothetical protein SDC9_90186 [bioreactor metagenome]|uniref:RNA polymerase sigma-70 region 2 domain-containing protein n=1 Tax=bioreactor metagenome TaxID=1076179 RepID=A0A644ZR95_9ZZZZ|nr:sigma factor [Bacteroidaceae bacterium]MEA4971646.1 sigma factor [Candidatus Metalachnospira sp.]
MIFITFNSKDERDEFYYLYEKYNKLLYKYAFDILNNHQDVEDVLQVAWLKISENVDKIITETDRRKVNYMITILKNSAYNKIKERTTIYYGDGKSEQATKYCYE